MRGFVELISWSVVIILLMVVLSWFVRDEPKEKQEGYDERQVLAQGKANKAGLTAGVVYLLLLQLAEFWEDFPLSIQEVSIIGILVMLLTYVTVAVWKDAYLRLRQKEGSAIGWMVFVGIMQLIGWPTLTERLIGISCFYIAALIALRRFLRKREEREEDDG